MSNASNTLNGPSAFHANKRITFCSSFEEMENHQLAYYASQSPEELLANHKAISMAAFGLQKEPDLASVERKIKFGKAS